jgi:hypothetical protein
VKSGKPRPRKAKKKRIVLQPALGGRRVRPTPTLDQYDKGTRWVN